MTNGISKKNSLSAIRDDNCAHHAPNDDNKPKSIIAELCWPSTARPFFSASS
jgi:hypothetical protein